MKIYHGDIVTCDRDNRVCRYLVENYGRIEFVGDLLPEQYARGGETVELGGRALLPAFADTHLHFSNWALIATAFFDPREANDFDDLGRMIRDFSLKDRKSKILAGFGLSQHSLKERRLVTREELDGFENGRPVYLICYDGHSAVVNTRMLELIPEGIRSVRGFDAATGLLLHEAYYAATDFVTKTIPVTKLVRGIVGGYDLLARKGIGTIHPVEGIGFPMDLDVDMVRFVAKAAARKNRFTTRLFFQTMEIEKVLKRGLPRIGGCFSTALDGCFGRCDAALNEPYSHDRSNRGILFHSDEAVTAFAKLANRAGLQIEMHAIGDAAVDQAVGALDAALRDCPREDHRHTIIHACLLSRKSLERCAELGIGITLQPGFIASPLEPPEYIESILGDRARSISPLRTAVDAGIRLSGGSDAPVTPPDPIDGLYGACNHPYDPGQSLTVAEALRMYTYEAARVGFDEKERGTLEKGKIADMTILNRNPLVMKPAELRGLEVEGLYLAGKPYGYGMGTAEMVWNSLVSGKTRI